MCVRSIKSSWGEGCYPCVLRKPCGEARPQASSASLFVEVEAGLGAVREGFDAWPTPKPVPIRASELSLAPSPYKQDPGAGLVTGVHRPAGSTEQGCRSPMLLKAPRVQERTSSRGHLELYPYRPLSSKGRAWESAPLLAVLGRDTWTKHPERVLDTPRPPICPSFGSLGCVPLPGLRLKMTGTQNP